MSYITERDLIVAAAVFAYGDEGDIGDWSMLALIHLNKARANRT
jgi:hypothetical protein